MDLPTIIGLSAGLLTTSGFIPQIVKGHRTGSMEDISLGMPLVLMLGMTLWLIYGIYLWDLPIILWNAAAIGLNAVLVLMKLRSKGALEMRTGV
ncbi:MAG: SemiSWEET transporter [Methanomassiliicoccales archaeon]|nr:SemiSWEET transporter [Methanomassiliicoccales archaeon]